jgi:DNA-binding Lrp family transcriptional regulator
MDNKLVNFNLNMNEISDKTELKIIEFLNENGPSFLGEVVKNLKISNSKGLKITNQLLTKGIIRHSDPPLQYELNSEPK